LRRTGRFRNYIATGSSAEALAVWRARLQTLSVVLSIGAAWALVPPARAQGPTGWESRIAGHWMITQATNTTCSWGDIDIAPVKGAGASATETGACSGGPEVWTWKVIAETPIKFKFVHVTAAGAETVLHLSFNPDWGRSNTVDYCTLTGNWASGIHIGFFRLKKKDCRG
jgi:hypothetical protein